MAVDIFGISRSISKQVDLTIEQYNGSARDGELIVDLNPGPTQYRIFVGSANGTMFSAATGVDSVNIASNSFVVTGGPITSSGTITIDIPSRVINTDSTSRVTLFATMIYEPTGYEFMIKGVNAATGQINLERLTVVSSTGACNFSRFGQVDLGNSLGAPDATMIGNTLEIGITPTTNDILTWTIQYQKI